VSIRALFSRSKQRYIILGLMVNFALGWGALALDKVELCIPTALCLILIATKSWPHSARRSRPVEGARER
jgi:hypothetical protein